MKLKRSFWATTILQVLLVASLPVYAWTYKILMVPLFGKSHVFSMSAIAKSLVSRGHNVTMFIGEHFPLTLTDLRNQGEVNIMSYSDKTNGVQMDYEEMDEYCTKSAIETGANIQQQILAIMTTVYVILATINLNFYCRVFGARLTC